MNGRALPYAVTPVVQIEGEHTTIADPLQPGVEMRENAIYKAWIVGSMEAHQLILRPNYRVACPIRGLVNAVLRPRIVGRPLDAVGL